MPSVLLETQQIGDSLKYSSPESPLSSFQAPYYLTVKDNEEPSPSSSVSKISPLILLVIIVLAVIFFVYGIVHLVLWLLTKTPSSSSPLYHSNRFPESTRSRVFQRQLHHLFRLHDSGLEQSLIDALPVFYYEDVLGLKEPFDCAVCLCEFSEQDKLRLLPMCGHAFHISCLDTWLLSNTTCPLCRATISSSSGFSMENLLFNDENSWVLNRFKGDEENVTRCSDAQRVLGSEDGMIEKRVFSVRLGKFRNINGGAEEVGEEEGGSSNMDGRRCFSMGSYQYVVSGSNLQVVMSDVSDNEEAVEGKKIGDRVKGESFSVSKIWLWSNKSKYRSSSDDAALPWLL
ncbi:RING-H2 finger protein ATL46-like [Prosopis cineraria]|uniref:RING-H2 finger protein ATL46-like n=1 Tax=Prosopis cineraria TaxID=364024 RepID=UPI00240F703F|nr:RING-H2 finger protein ATL46-like [Prosopis cineraria]